MTWPRSDPRALAFCEDQRGVAHALSEDALAAMASWEADEDEVAADDVFWGIGVLRVDLAEIFFVCFVLGLKSSRKWKWKKRKADGF